MRPFIFTLALALALTAAAAAQPHGGKGDMMRKHIEKLNLSDEQKDAIQNIRSAAEKQMIDLRSSMQKLRIDMRTMNREDGTDRAAFETLARTMADIQVQQKLLMFDTRDKIMKQLDTEQQEEFRKLQKMRMAKRGEHMRGKRGGRHGR